MVAEPAPTPPPSGGLPRLPLLLTLVLRPPLALGMRCSTSATAERPVLSMVALSTKITGASWLSGSRRMREPVMTISLPGPLTPGAAWGACPATTFGGGRLDCAAAALEIAIAATATPALKITVRFIRFPRLRLAGRGFRYGSEAKRDQESAEAHCRSSDTITYC